MTPNDPEYRNRVIARLLWYGTWCASAVVAAGLLLRFLQSSSHLVQGSISGDEVIKAGVGIFIALPVCRVALMLVLFLRERDFLYAFISALVLAIIAIGVVLGVSH